MPDIETQIRAVGLKHSELLRLLAEIDDVRPELKHQEEMLTDLTSKIAESDLKLENLDWSRRSHLREHGKYRNSFMRRFLYKAGGKKEVFAELAEKEQRDYLDVVQQAQEEQTVNSELKAQVDEAQKRRKDLESTVQRRNNLQQQLTDLHESIFAGPTPDFPRDDAKKAKVKEQAGICQRVKSQDETQAMAVEVLDEASQAMTVALKHLDQAIVHQRMIYMDSSTVYSGLQRVAAIRQAEQSVQYVRGRIKRLPPAVAFLPRVSMDLSSMSVEDSLDKLLGEIHVQRSIERAREDTVRCAVAINDGLDQAKMRKRALAAELRRAEDNMEKAKLDLQKERQRIFKKVLGGKSRLSSRAATPIMS